MEDWWEAIRLKPEEQRRNQDGPERRRILVFGSRGTIVVVMSDLITGRRLPDQKALRLSNILSSPLGCQICLCLNYPAHCKPAATPHLLPVLG